MKKIIYSTLLILLALTLSTCDKNDCQNCYPTVFECKVDGKTWKTSCESKDFFGCTALDVQHTPTNNSLDIYAINDDDNESISLFVRKNKIKIGENKLWHKTSIFQNKYNCGRYYIDTLNENSFIITRYDTINQILKGNFSFIAIDSCGNKIKVTQGKLDVIYRN